MHLSSPRSGNTPQESIQQSATTHQHDTRLMTKDQNRQAPQRQYAFHTPTAPTSVGRQRRPPDTIPCEIIQLSLQLPPTIFTWRTSIRTNRRATYDVRLGLSNEKKKSALSAPIPINTFISSWFLCFRVSGFEPIN